MVLPAIDELKEKNKHIMMIQFRNMEIFKNVNQKNNVAKYCFDVSKILLAIIVIAPLVREETTHFYLTVGGVFLAFMFFLIGYL